MGIGPPGCPSGGVEGEQVESCGLLHKCPVVDEERWNILYLLISDNPRSVPFSSQTQHPPSGGRPQDTDRPHTHTRDTHASPSLPKCLPEFSASTRAGTEWLISQIKWNFDRVWDRGWLGRCGTPPVIRGIVRCQEARSVRFPSMLELLEGGSLQSE